MGKSCWRLSPHRPPHPLTLHHQPLHLCTQHSRNELVLLFSKCVEAGRGAKPILLPHVVMDSLCAVCDECCNAALKTSELAAMLKTVQVCGAVLGTGEVRVGGISGRRLGQRKLPPLSAGGGSGAAPRGVRSAPCNRRVVLDQVLLAAAAAVHFCSTSPAGPQNPCLLCFLALTFAAGSTLTTCGLRS